MDKIVVVIFYSTRLASHRCIITTSIYMHEPTANTEVKQEQSLKKTSVKKQYWHITVAYNVPSISYKLSHVHVQTLM